MKILFLGDSYTSGEGVHPAFTWPRLLERRLEEEKVPVETAKIIAQTGWTTEELNESITVSPPEKNFDLVTILVGVNDQYRGHDLKNYRKEFSVLLAKAIQFAQNNPERVLVISIPGYDATPFAQDKDNLAARKKKYPKVTDVTTAQIAKSIDLFNAAIKEIVTQQNKANEKKISFIDITPITREHGDKTISDGLHPSAEAYSSWVTLIFPQVKSLVIPHHSNTASLAFDSHSYFSFLNPMLSYFNSPIETKEPEPAAREKKGRARSDFKKNQTASLALPDEIQTFKKDFPSSFEKSSTFSIGEMLTSLYTVFTKSTAEEKQQYVTLGKNNIPLDKQIESLEYLLQRPKEEIICGEILLQKVELVAELIKEHASRRVDLFFYLLVAVHGKYVEVEKDHTVKQHGKGSALKGTQACHCSLFPCVKLTPLPTKWYSFAPAEQPTLQGTYLEEALNVTIELPTIVNDFDGKLEGRYERTKYVDNFLAILNKAARNEITPREGMNEFFKTMNDFFNAYEKRFLRSKKGDSYLAFRKIWEYQKIGTFQSANKDRLTVSNEYLYLMLRIKPEGQTGLWYKPDSYGLAEYYQRIQDEIYASIPVASGVTRRRKIS